MTRGRPVIEQAPDVLDAAADLTARTTDAIIEEARCRARPEQEQLPDGSWPHTSCLDCGEDIEPQRLILGRIRCFACQSARESRHRRGLS